MIGQMLKKLSIFLFILHHLMLKNLDNKESYETNFFKSKNIRQGRKNKCRKWLIVSTSSEFGVRSNKIKKIDVIK